MQEVFNIDHRCLYDTGKKLTKAEKKIKEEKEMQVTKKKLEQLQPTKTDKQEKKEEKPQKEEDDKAMDTDDMPLLISNTVSDDGSKGTKKKHIVNKKPTKPPLRKK